VEFVGYEPAEEKGVDLAKAEVIVSAGRGIGKKENVRSLQRWPRRSAASWGRAGR